MYTYSYVFFIQLWYCLLRMFQIAGNLLVSPIKNSMSQSYSIWSIDKNPDISNCGYGTVAMPGECPPVSVRRRREAAKARRWVRSRSSVSMVTRPFKQCRYEAAQEQTISCTIYLYQFCFMSNWRQSLLFFLGQTSIETVVFLLMFRKIWSAHVRRVDA